MTTGAEPFLFLSTGCVISKASDARVVDSPCFDVPACFKTALSLSRMRVQVLEWTVGDSFDFSMVLCSLLLGAGYDAYVVHGTAPGYVRFL